MAGLKIYISGPISGLPNGNLEAFLDAERQLQDAGHTPVNPHRNGLPSSATWEQHMRIDLKMLANCDAVAVLPGCNKSRGVAEELALARKMLMPIMTVCQWVEDADKKGVRSTGGEK